MPTQTFRRLAFVSAFASLGIVATFTLLAGAAVPGYSHLAQFMSELGASGAQHEWSVRLLGFLPAGVTLLLFCYAAHLVLPRSTLTSLATIGLAIFAAGYVVSAAFPCDFGCRPKNPSTSQIIHNVCGLAGYLAAPIFLFAFAREAHKWPSARVVCVSGYIASSVALLGLLMIDPSSPIAGLGQRLLEGSVLMWSVLCGYYISVTSASKNSAA